MVSLYMSRTSRLHMSRCNTTTRYNWCSLDVRCEARSRDQSIWLAHANMSWHIYSLYSVCLQRILSSLDLEISLQRIQTDWYLDRASYCGYVTRLIHNESGEWSNTRIWRHICVATQWFGDTVDTWLASLRDSPHSLWMRMRHICGYVTRLIHSEATHVFGDTYVDTWLASLRDSPHTHMNEASHVDQASYCGYVTQHILLASFVPIRYVYICTRYICRICRVYPILWMESWLAIHIHIHILHIHIHILHIHIHILHILHI